MNKSLITNLSALAAIAAGYYLPHPAATHLFEVGIFAAAGAITNWLAIHMLFEKVPGLYGSGVIPNRFEEFKAGIHQLIMQQFFTRENIDKFLHDKDQKLSIDYKTLLSGIDMDEIFKGLTDVVLNSNFGGMLNMFGGVSALDSLKEPFADKMNEVLLNAVESQTFQAKIQEAAQGSLHAEDFHPKIEAIVKKRLDELTPEMIKIIVQDIIKTHLAWLVVWGGVFGGLIGLLTSLLRT